MAGKMNATTVVALVMVLVAMATMSIMISTAEARLDLSSILGDIGNNEESTIIHKPRKRACCDMCLCTRSLFRPKCQCRDIGRRCHDKCKSCVCIGSKPTNYKCRCMDVTDFCFPTCSSNNSSSNHAVADAFVNGTAN